MVAPDNSKSEPKAGFHPDTAPPPLDQRTGLQPPSTINSKQHKAQTARTLAYWLVGILAGSVILQYVTLMILIGWGNVKEVEYLEHLFNAWLPVVAGLASSAATYYFTKQN